MWISSSRKTGNSVYSYTVLQLFPPLIYQGCLSMSIHVNSPFLKSHYIKFYWMDTLCNLFSIDEYLDGFHVFTSECTNGHSHVTVYLYDEKPRSGITGTKAMGI